MSINGEVVNTTDKLAVQCFDMIKNMYSKEYSEIWNMFYGIHVSQIKDLSSEDILACTPEPFFMIDLSIPPELKSPSLMDCFDHYVKGETLEGENAWYNESVGKKQEIHKVTAFWNLPKILVISLKRFSTDGKRKLMHLVNFPLENLNLSKYVKGYNAKQYTYDLYGVCNHFGGVQGGHYTAFVKHADGSWLHFNDTSVDKITDLSQIVSPAAYCLFYRKKDSK
jgi:ubiquitin C-terminal hydrolase